jgi:hypothetical protein
VEILLRQFLVDVGVAASGWLLCIEAAALGSNVATTRWDGVVVLYHVGDNLELSAASLLARSKCPRGGGSMPRRLPRTYSGSYGLWTIVLFNLG